ncbi:MAG: lysylphosphatidylglycerol synthase domain-containing protein, partial [Candidatus Nanohaloarchaeota archaeon QJJ-9]|nr:lysylphosphatidylglycerol synthase domain-containing protein [Candidatus Nanohaloarchaeota archaeon QJJ-9]
FYPMNGFLRLISVLLLVFCTLLVAAFSLLWFRREIAESVIIGFTSRLKRLLDSLKIFKSFQKRLDPGYVVDKLEAFYAAMEDVFSSRKDVIEVMGTAFFALFLGMLSLYSFSVAVNGVPSFAAIMFILPVSMVASYLPLPGGIGSIDLVMISLLYFLTPLSFAEGSAAVILFRFTTFILPLVIGGIATLRMSIDISKAMVESETS